SVEQFRSIIIAQRIPSAGLCHSRLLASPYAKMLPPDGNAIRIPRSVRGSPSRRPVVLSGTTTEKTPGQGVDSDPSLFEASEPSQLPELAPESEGAASENLSFRRNESAQRLAAEPPRFSAVGSSGGLGAFPRDKPNTHH